MLPMFVAAILLLPITQAGSRVRCTSTMRGDFTYATCGAFCTESKKVNHCRYCKCRTCSFCVGETPSGSISAWGGANSTHAKSTKVLSTKSTKSTKSKRTKSAVANGSTISGSIPAARASCSSKLKGDYPYQACGTFCNEAKKRNHCQWCKCKACSFCSDAKRKPDGTVDAHGPVTRKPRGTLTRDREANLKERGSNVDDTDTSQIIFPVGTPDATKRLPGDLHSLPSATERKVGSARGNAKPLAVGAGHETTTPLHAPFTHNKGGRNDDATLNSSRLRSLVVWIIVLSGVGAAAAYAHRHVGSGGPPHERGAFLRDTLPRANVEEDETSDLLHPGLDEAFRSVEALERSLEAKSATSK